MKAIIYQAKNPTFHVDKDVETYFEKDYNKVWTTEVEPNEKDTHILEGLFMYLQDFKPIGFNGWSLSVGDIVLLGDKAYICANHGWEKIKFVGCATNLPQCDNLSDFALNNID